MWHEVGGKLLFSKLRVGNAMMQVVCDILVQVEVKRRRGFEFYSVLPILPLLPLLPNKNKCCTHKHLLF